MLVHVRRLSGVNVCMNVRNTMPYSLCILSDLTRDSKDVTSWLISVYTINVKKIQAQDNDISVYTTAVDKIQLDTWSDLSASATDIQKTQVHI